MPIMGTRPEAIKLAPVIKELEKQPEHFQIAITVTAQHRGMLDQVLDWFKITPKYDLNIMRPRQDLFGVTNRMLNGLKPILKKENPSLVLVQGDTTTTLTAALAAFYSRIPVAHIEAGLRTHNKRQPFPEEINRRLVSHIADWHFAPTKVARQNLLYEGIPEERIFVTGNTVIDSLLMTIKENYVFDHPVLSRVDFDSNKIILVTAHRRENLGKPMRNICEAIRQLIAAYSSVVVVFSVHLNPMVQKTVRDELVGTERVFLLEPLGYESFVQLINKSYLILTDSGGIQEEASSLGKPVLVLRNVTERPEGITAGVLKVVGTESGKIFLETARLLDDQEAYITMAQEANSYGDGRASVLIVENLMKLKEGSLDKIYDE
jgi:UDP-N-acetylglucosamine 2-epimerase (non-hydrolysing)